MDSEMLIAAEAGAVLTSASEVLNSEADNSGSAEKIFASKFFKNKRAAVLASKESQCLGNLASADATRVLVDHILHFVPAMFDNYSHYEVCCHLSLNM